MSRGRNPGKTNASATAAPETKAGRETFSTDAACVRFSQVKDGNSTQHTFAFTCFSFSLCRAFHGKVLFVLLSETLPLAGWAVLKSIDLANAVILVFVFFEKEKVFLFKTCWDVGFSDFTYFLLSSIPHAPSRSNDYVDEVGGFHRILICTLNSPNASP